MRIRKPWNGDLRSLRWKLGTRGARLLERMIAGHDSSDDFDWERYHLEYSSQLHEMEKIHTLRLVSTEVTLDRSGGIVDECAGRPLHGNHRLLYETILQLAPSSVLEVGCGGGDHLANLLHLSPGTVVQGVDRSTHQVAFALERNPSLTSRLVVSDASLPFPHSVNSAQLAFTQAVLQHMQTGNSHLVALWNLFSKATTFVLLVENLERHDLPRDIERLQERGLISWDKLRMQHLSMYGASAILVSND